MSELKAEEIEYIIERVLKMAADIQEERDKHRGADDDLFYEGMLTAYHEVLDVIKTQLRLYEMSLKDFGLDVDIEKLTA